MTAKARPRIALVWTQFTAYHVDRCVALAERMAGRAEVLAVEVATSSRDYGAFSPSGAVAGARKRTLFPGAVYDKVPRWRRCLALVRALAGCKVVFCGIPYSDLEILIVTIVLRLTGTRVVLLCDSKFDDSPRRAGFEFLKRIGLLSYSAVMVAGARGVDYMRFLGFRQRPVLAGCDTVSIARVRAGIAGDGAASLPFEGRPFVFVGRFIAKKNLPLLIRAYARYVAQAGARARGLELIGTGVDEPALREMVAELRLDHAVQFRGFLEGVELTRAVAAGAALLLVSYSEQWGLVVNEALALGIPVIATQAPGARDVLVRNLVNGYVVENGSVEGLARAMLALGEDEQAWRRMRASALELAPLGDVEVFCDAVEQVLDPTASAAGTRGAQFMAALETYWGRQVR